MLEYGYETCIVGARRLLLGKNGPEESRDECGLLYDGGCIDHLVIEKEMANTTCENEGRWGFRGAVV